ncbi:MAG: GntR family transcriptional regulator [Bradyrhizobium sp.]
MAVRVGAVLLRDLSKDNAVTTDRDSQRREPRKTPGAVKGTQVRQSPKLEWEAICDMVEARDVKSRGKAESVNSVTYSSLKKMILVGQLGPGCKLVHEELADNLNVSRTPVREALERLYQEGFVTRLPRRGFYVAGITREEAFDLYSAREALELYSLKAALDRGPLSRSALDALKAYAKRYSDAISPPALTERILADVLFHLKLAELSGNRYVLRLLAQTFERLALKRRHEGYRYDRSIAAAAEHAQLLDALEKHDIKGSMHIIAKHIISAREALLSELYELA